MFVADHASPDVVGEAAFEAAHRFVVGLAGGDLGVVVGPAGAAGHADLGERDHVEGVVELPVAAAWQAVSGVVGGGDFDGGDAGVAGERCCGREPAGSPGAAEQLGGDDRSDPVDLA